MLILIFFLHNLILKLYCVPIYLCRIRCMLSCVLFRSQWLCSLEVAKSAMDIMAYTTYNGKWERNIHFWNVIDEWLWGFFFVEKSAINKQNGCRLIWERQASPQPRLNIVLNMDPTFPTTLVYKKISIFHLSHDH